MTMAEQLREEVRQSMRGEVMTMAEQLREEGRMDAIAKFHHMSSRWKEEGMKKGESTLLMRLLERKFPFVPTLYKQWIHQANTATLLEWGERLIECDTLEEIFSNEKVK